MDECIQIKLVKEDGTKVPVDKVTKEGLVLRDETDAFPRRFAVIINPRGRITEIRMDGIRRKHGWSAGKFHFKISAASGRLILKGVDENSFPPGYYWMRLRIEDLRAKKAVYVKLKKDKKPLIEMPVADDSRRIEINPIESFDNEILRILQVPESRIDRMKITNWLSSDKPRSSRKACLLNILARLRTLPTISKPLIKHLEQIIFVATDRIYAQLDPKFYEELTRLAKQDSKPFYYEGSPTSPLHAKLLLKIKPPDPHGDRFKLHSFRHEKDPSLQATVAVPNINSDASSHFADLDIDLGNPLRDVKGFITHMGELICPGKTDHLALWKKLRNAVDGDYLSFVVTGKYSG